MAEVDNYSPTKTPNAVLVKKSKTFNVFDKLHIGRDNKECLIILHKCCYCLHYLRDYDKTIEIAMNSCKSESDTQLILGVVRMLLSPNQSHKTIAFNITSDGIDIHLCENNMKFKSIKNLRVNSNKNYRSNIYEGSDLSNYRDILHIDGIKRQKLIGSTDKPKVYMLARSNYIECDGKFNSTIVRIIDLKKLNYNNIKLCKGNAKRNVRAILANIISKRKSSIMYDGGIRSEDPMNGFKKNLKTVYGKDITNTGHINSYLNSIDFMDTNLLDYNVYSKEYDCSPVEGDDYDELFDNNRLMTAWRYHYNNIKSKIFKTCNLLHININIPLMAIDMLSRIFRNVNGSTDRLIRCIMCYIFDKYEETHRSSSTPTTLDIAMLYLIASNCIQLALYHHNMNVRFDIGCIFYYLTFVDVICYSIECNDSKSFLKLGKILPPIINGKEQRVVLQKKLTFGVNFIEHTFPYHNNLIRNNYGHLITELKKNRILRIITQNSLSIPSSLSYLLFLSHGFYGTKLQQLLNKSGTNTKQINLADLSISSDCSIPPSSELHGWPDSEEYRINSEKDGSQHSAYDPLKPDENKNTTFAQEKNTEYFIDVHEKDDILKLLDIGLLLLEMLSCSEYIEYINGNTLYTLQKEHKCNKVSTHRMVMNSQSLNALIVIRYILDIYVSIDFEFLKKYIHWHNNEGYPEGLSKLNNGETLEEFMGVIKNHLDKDSFNKLNDNYSILYLVILNMDWLLYKNNLYTRKDLVDFRLLYESVNNITTPSLSNHITDEISFEEQHELYTSIVFQILKSDNTQDMVRIYSDSIKSWKNYNNIIDQFSTRNTYQDSENQKFILEIHYPDLKSLDYGWNPYNSVFTDNSLILLKDIIFRSKLLLLVLHFC